MSYTLKEKKIISKEIYNYTYDDIIKDFLKLKDISCSKINLGSTIGNKIVNYYTAHERLNTIGRAGITFFEFYKNRNKFINKQYINKLLKYNLSHGKNNLQSWFDIFRLYKGSISIFKPIIAKNIYCMFKPKSILDFTMGWGGRMVGACSLDINNYIGIELNKNLIKPLTEMKKELNKYSTTNIDLIFNDCLKVDYSKLYYDLVLTSPPYYNIELYHGTNKRTIEIWNEQFYKPIFIKTYDGLQKGGIYCLNVPIDVYKNVCINVFGKYHKRIEMYKTKRGDPNNEPVKEYIYIWFK